MRSWKTVLVAVLGLGLLSATARAQCPAGVEVGGACWFISVLNESCTATCAAAGLAYDEATRTFAGSSGTTENCNAVMNALGVGAGSTQSVHCDVGIGCFYDQSDAQRYLCIDPATTADGSGDDDFRACACNSRFIGAPAASKLGLGVLSLLIGSAGMWRLSLARRSRRA